MARLVERLDALKVERQKKPGMFPDGRGLYLQVRDDGDGGVTKSWIFRFMLNRRARAMGLGPLHDLSLSKAREAAADCRTLLRKGIDPIEARKAARAKDQLEEAKSITFRECARRFIDAHKPSWRNAKHADQWKNTLATYAEPVFGTLSVQAIDVGLVLKVLEPIWSIKPETAGRMRGRIEAILDWATARGYRQGENPARWRGHLDKLLPKRSKLRKVKNHPALPFDEIAKFLVELRQKEGIAARALEFAILTGARTGEVIGTRPREFTDRVWTISAERMKGNKQHRVPLSDRAAQIVQEMRQHHPDTEFLFPGAKRGKPLSNMAMLELLRGMRRKDGKQWCDRHGQEIVPHGFRSTFRDWASERTSYPREVIEMSLAHTIDDKVEAAYRRGDLFEKRRRLINDWAKFCSTPARVRESGNVTQLRAPT
jgi:integrase